MTFGLIDVTSVTESSRDYRDYFDVEGLAAQATEQNETKCCCVDVVAVA